MTPLLDDDAQLWGLLEQVAIRAPLPLLPELSLYQAQVVEDVWEAVEVLAGHKTEPPYWAFVWPGGQAVARYLLDRPSQTTGLRVLDVATGNGVIALAAAMTGAVVTANDIDPVALRLTWLHAELHGLHVTLHQGDLLGEDPASLPFDLITVGDAFYESSLANRLEPWLHAAHRAGREVLLGDPGRNFLPGQRLTAVAEYQIETLKDVEGHEVRTARVFRISD